jgi:hypothetical protein
LDEWVQQIYRQAAMPPPAYAGPLPEVHSDLTRIRIEESPTSDTEISEALGEIHAGKAFRMRSEDTEPEEDDEEGRPYLLTRQGGRAAFVRRLREMASAAGHQTADGLRQLARLGLAAAGGILRLKRARMALLGALIIGVAGGGLWIAAHTSGVTSRAPGSAPTVEQAALAPPVVTDPYTLQVAAYLKQEYALKFVQDLKAHGLDAYYTETTSGGKRWYQVRISHFPDQQSAREFGRNLKWKGLVDDFYVTNYVR